MSIEHTFIVKIEDTVFECVIARDAYGIPAIITPPTAVSGFVKLTSEQTKKYSATLSSTLQKMIIDVFKDPDA